MGQHVERAGLRVDDQLCAFVENEALPGSGIEVGAFWSRLAELAAEFAPRHRALLDERDRLQRLIDQWHIDHREAGHDAVAYRAFLESIGYIVPVGAPFEIGTAEQPSAVLLEHHGLGIELVIDRGHAVGADDPAGIADVVVESAITTIVDLEDSVAAVDGPDKVGAYRNWLGLMRGDLESAVDKAGSRFIRRLDPDRTYTAVDGGEVRRRGRSLLLIRNVGHLMTTPALCDGDGNELPEGMLDAVGSTLIAK